MRDLRDAVVGLQPPGEFGEQPAVMAFVFTNDQGDLVNRVAHHVQHIDDLVSVGLDIRRYAAAIDVHQANMPNHS